MCVCVLEKEREERQTVCVHVLDNDVCTFLLILPDIVSMTTIAVNRKYCINLLFMLLLSVHSLHPVSAPYSFY